MFSAAFAAKPVRKAGEADCCAVLCGAVYRAGGGAFYPADAGYRTAEQDRVLSLDAVFAVSGRTADSAVLAYPAA